MLTRLWHDQSGQSMAEYGLLTALIAAVSIVAAKALGLAVAEKFADLAKAIGK